MGGNPSGNKDVIENLMSVCRSCHNKCEWGEISKDEQRLIHIRHMDNFDIKS